MRSRVLACLLPAACLLCGQRPTPLESGDLCRIEGRVVNSITGDPVRRASLTLNLAAREPATRTATSDADGRFSFDGLPPGRFMLSAQRTGFMSLMYAATPAPPQLSPGQVLKDIVLKLVPQGIIAGKVLDDEGEPVSRAMVQAMAAPGSGRRAATGGSSATTNDLGEFRLAELPPGRYIVRANPMRGPMSTGATGEALLGTYYPAAAEQASATALEVGAGIEVSGITIRLRRGNVYRVQGSLVATSADETLSNIMVQLRPRPMVSGGIFYMPSVGARTSRPDGSFELANVEPGAYDLIAMRAGGAGTLIGRIPLVVTTGDLTGVVLRLRDPLRIAGTIRMEGPEQAGFSPVRVLLRPLEALPMGTPNATVAGDRSFVLENVAPDRYFLTVMPLPPGGFVRSVRTGNQESLDSILDLTEAQTGATVDILVSPNGATVEGIVKGLDTLSSRAYVSLVPDPPGPGALHRMMMRPAMNGKFQLPGVPPGDYRLYAFEEMLVTQQDDPSVLRPYESKALRLTVAERDRKQVEVAIIKPPEAK